MRLGSKIWHSVRTSPDNAEIDEFSAPVEFVTRFNYITVQQAITRGYMEVVKYGEKLSNTWTVIANAAFFHDVFHVGDLMWVDGAEPDETAETTYGNGASANAVIKNVAEVNRTISITLERKNR